MICIRVPCLKRRPLPCRGRADDMEGSASIGQPCSLINADPLHFAAERSPSWSGGDDGDYGVADFDLVAFLQALSLVNATVVEPGAVGGVQVLDEPEAVGQLEQGVLAGGVLIADYQAALSARGELLVEGVRLAAGLDDDRLGRRSLGQGGVTRAGDRGDGGPPGRFLLRAGVVPRRERARLGTPVSFVGGLGETVDGPATNR